MTDWGLTHQDRENQRCPDPCGVEASVVGWLDYQDSNLGKQNQNLLCYHYTIVQSKAFAGGVPVDSAQGVPVDCRRKVRAKWRDLQVFRRLFCGIFFVGPRGEWHRITLHGVGMQLRPRSASHDEVVVFLASLHQQVAAIEQVVGSDGPVEGGDPLLVERHAAALHELAHLAP